MTYVKPSLELMRRGVRNGEQNQISPESGLQLSKLIDSAVLAGEL